MASINRVINVLTRYCGGSRSLAWLLLTNVAVSVTIWIATLTLKLCGQSPEILYTLTSLPSDALAFAQHPWTLLTYMFVHFSLLHLIFNMLWLYWFGQIASDGSNGKILLRLYIGGGVLGGILYIAVSLIPGYMPGAYLAGASASVLSIVCASAIMKPDSTMNLFLIGNVRLKWIAVACVLLTLACTLPAGIPTFAAHAGGIIFGMVWALVNRKSRSYPFNFSFSGNKYQNRKDINIRATVRAMNKNLPDEARLDELLDKMRISGYDSLSEKEKTELNYI